MQSLISKNAKIIAKCVDYSMAINLLNNKTQNFTSIGVKLYLAGVICEEYFYVKNDMNACKEIVLNIYENYIKNYTLKDVNRWATTYLIV